MTFSYIDSYTYSNPLLLVVCKVKSDITGYLRVCKSITKQKDFYDYSVTWAGHSFCQMKILRVPVVSERKFVVFQ